MKNSDNQSNITYNQEEIQEILQIAIASQSLSHNDQGEMTQEQLWEIAVELGIDRNTITSVEKDWQQKQLIQQKRNEFNAYRREEFQNKIIRFSIINLFLVAINLLGAHQLSWSLYIVLIWGLFLALNGWQTFETKGENYEKAFLNWERKYQLKESFTNLWQKLQQFMQSLINEN
jgi:hypothetical protein